MGISRVLNVTAHLPLSEESNDIHYKTLPALDSGHQNLRQYFDEAIRYIGKKIILKNNLNGYLYYESMTNISQSKLYFSKM